MSIGNYVEVNNKIVINPTFKEAIGEMGGEVISETEVELQEKQKDTYDQVAADVS